MEIRDRRCRDRPRGRHPSVFFVYQIFSVGGDPSGLSLQRNWPRANMVGSTANHGTGGVRNRGNGNRTRYAPVRLNKDTLLSLLVVRCLQWEKNPANCSRRRKTFSWWWSTLPTCNRPCGLETSQMDVSTYIIYKIILQFSLCDLTKQFKST